MKKWLSENATILTLLAAFVAANIPNLTTPAWWDEAGAYLPPSIAVAAKGLWVALPGGHPRGLLWGHPPVLYLIHGSLYQLFGISIFPHRVAALAFAVIGILFTYRLGKLLCGRSTGLCAAMLLACSPMFFAQSPMVLGDLPITSLGAVSAFYLFTRQRLAYVLATILLLQTKETALATAVAAAIYEFFFTRKETDGWSTFLTHAVPIGSLAAFFGIEFVRTGTFVQAPYFGYAPFFIFDWRDPVRAVFLILEQARWVTRVIFFGEGRFLLTGMLLIGALHWRKFWKPEFSLLGLVIALYWTAFWGIGFLPRYVMPVLPFLCIAAAWSVYVVFKNRTAAQYAVVCSACLVFLPFFNRWSESGDFETNMRYKKAIAVCQRVSEYLEANFGVARIAADWPLGDFLRVPELGYVNTPQKAVVTAAMRREEELSRDLFVYFSIGPSRRTMSLMGRAIGPPLQRFEEDGIFAEVYRLSSSDGR